MSNDYSKVTTHFAFTKLSRTQRKIKELGIPNRHEDDVQRTAHLAGCQQAISAFDANTTALAEYIDRYSNELGSGRRVPCFGDAPNSMRQMHTLTAGAPEESPKKRFKDAHVEQHFIEDSGMSLWPAKRFELWELAGLES